MSGMRRRRPLCASCLQAGSPDAGGVVPTLALSLVVMRRQVISEIKQKTKGVVYWGSGEPKPDDAEALKKAKVPLYSWDQFVELGTSKPADPVPPKEMDTCTIMYTR